MKRGLEHLFIFVVMSVVFCFCTSEAWAYSGGDGQEATPFLIADADDWIELMETSGDWASYFRLTNDINLAGIALTPVGNSTTNFSGVFDGSHHVIRNVTMDTPTSDYVGLFGAVIVGVVQNLGVENGSITGQSYVGLLAGAIGTGAHVVHCYATGSVTGYEYIGGLIGSSSAISVECCYATGTVIGSSGVGGLLGCIGSDFCSQVIKCWAFGSVTGDSDVGGLVGHSWYGNISCCYSGGSANGRVGSNDIGGLVGELAYSSLTDSFATTTVSGLENSNCLGGMIGMNYGEVSACFWDTDTSGQASGVGCGSADGMYGRTTTAMRQQAIFTSSPFLWDFTNETVNGTNDYWRMCVDGVDYPRLNWESIDGDFACPDGVTMEDLDYFIERWLGADCESSNNYCGGADINSSGTVDQTDFSILANHWLEGE